MSNIPEPNKNNAKVGGSILFGLFITISILTILIDTKMSYFASGWFAGYAAFTIFSIWSYIYDNKSSE